MAGLNPERAGSLRWRRAASCRVWRLTSSGRAPRRILLAGRSSTRPTPSCRGGGTRRFHDPAAAARFCTVGATVQPSTASSKWPRSKTGRSIPIVEFTALPSGTVEHRRAGNLLDGTRNRLAGSSFHQCRARRHLARASRRHGDERMRGSGRRVAVPYPADPRRRGTSALRGVRSACHVHGPNGTARRTASWHTAKIRTRMRAIQPYARRAC